MAAPRKAPDRNWLEQHLRQKLSQSQMAALWEKETGIKLSRSTIGVALVREGLTGDSKPRYEDMLPWRVKSEHAMHREARLLRLEARRRRGEELSERNLQWLTSWRKELAAADAVVTYHPDTPEGFHWVRRKPSDTDIIRRPRARRKMGG